MRLEMKRIFGMAVALVCLVSLNCSDAGSIISPDGGGSPIPEPNPSSLHTLKSYDSCDEFMISFREQKEQEVIARLDEILKCPDIDGTIYYDDPIAFGPVTTDADSESSSIEFTDTNLQEKGVDEADIIKSDGEFLFVGTGESIEVFKVWPKSDFKAVDSFKIKEGVDELYLVDGKIFALSQFYDQNDGEFNHSGQGGLELRSYSLNNRALLTELAVSDEGQLSFVSSREFTGEYITSRVVDQVLHVTTNYYFPDKNIFPSYREYSPWRSTCQNDPQAKQKLEELKQEYIEKNREALKSMPVDDMVEESSKVTVVDCRNMFLDKNTSSNTAILHSISLGKKEFEKTTYVVGDVRQVYASTEAVYLNYSHGGWDESVSILHRFQIDGEDLHDYTGSGSVPGQIKDSLSMSEYQGVFRVVTSDQTLGNQLYTLDATQKDLPILGTIENIAPDEDVYAVRFFGDIGYLVTFKKIDPLFVVDLKDSKNPQIVGELKMPGYSTYLHRLDDENLIGLGKDADDQGDFAWFEGLKLALFDVENEATPQVKDDLIIGDRGSESAALYHHHAFTFDKTSGRLALPLMMYEGGDVGVYGRFSYNGVHLYDISSDGGIEELGVVKLPDDSTSPQRTLLISDKDEDLMYVLDSQNLYQVDLNEGHQISAQQDLPALKEYFIHWMNPVVSF